LALVLIVVISLQLAKTQQPDVSPPSDSEAQRDIAEVIHPEAADSVLRGDYVIERFYAIETANGRAFVVDLCKGRVTSIVASPRADLAGFSYTLSLDRMGLQRQHARIGSFIKRVSPSSVGSPAEYLGLQVQGGDRESFPLNFDGSLARRGPTLFRGPDGEDIYEYLRSVDFAAVSESPHLMGVDGTNYLLSNTERFPYFRELFGTGQAVFLSELIIVDATSINRDMAYRELVNNSATAGP
jgi:hypothetical protein